MFSISYLVYFFNIVDNTGKRFPCSHNPCSLNALNASIMSF